MVVMIYVLFLDNAWLKIYYNLQRILIFLIITMAIGPTVLTLNYYWHHPFFLKQNKTKQYNTKNRIIVFKLELDMICLASHLTHKNVRCSEVNWVDGNQKVIGVRGVRSWSL